MHGIEIPSETITDISSICQLMFGTSTYFPTKIPFKHFIYLNDK